VTLIGAPPLVEWASIKFFKMETLFITKISSNYAYLGNKGGSGSWQIAENLGLGKKKNRFQKDK